MKLLRKRIGDILVASGYVSQEQLNFVIETKSHDQKIGEALILNGLLTEQQLVQALSDQLKVHIITLHKVPVNERALALIDKEFAQRHSVFPFDVSEERLHVAMDDPLDYFVLEDLRLRTKMLIEVHLSTRTEITQAIARHYSEAVDGFGVAEEEVPPVDEAALDDAPIVKLVNNIIENAVTLG
ncbi:MAG: type II secretion system protein GspE, partial [Bacilli bacterium]